MAAATNIEPIYEFDESEIWNSGRSTSPEFRRMVPRKKSTAKKLTVVLAGETAAAKSVPVNVPDWSKMLKGESEYRRNDDVEEDDWVAPHEYLARSRVASYSVHEGRGRTLKGRDLSRVRNAIWEKMGFQD